jgi:DNA-binding beta-propeller fold protein YncE
MRRRNAYKGFVITSYAVIYREMEGVPLKAPASIFYDSHGDEYFVADAGNELVVAFNTNGMPVFSFGYNGELDGLKSVMVDKLGRIYAIAGRPLRVKVFNYRGEFIEDFDFPGVEREEDEMLIPTAMTVDKEGNLYFAASQKIYVYDLDHKLLRSFGEPGRSDGQLAAVTAMTVDDDGSIFLTDAMSRPVQVYTATGQYVRGWGEHAPGPMNFSLPTGITIDPYGKVLVIDTLRQTISAFGKDGTYVGVGGGYSKEPGGIAFPTSITLDKMGRICVTEKANNRVQFFREDRSKYASSPGANSNKRSDVGTGGTPAASVDDKGTPAASTEEPVLEPTATAGSEKQARLEE